MPQELDNIPIIAPYYVNLGDPLGQVLFFRSLNAAQADLVVPGGVWYRAVTIMFIFITDATVANRNFILRLFTEDEEEVFRIHPLEFQTASRTGHHTYSFQGPDFVFNTAGTGAWGISNIIPDLIIPPGWKWHLNLFNNQAGDSMISSGLPRAVVQIFPELPYDRAAQEAGRQPIPAPIEPLAV